MRDLTPGRRGRGRGDFFVLTTLALLSLLLGNLGEARKMALVETIRATALAPVLSVHRAVAAHVRLASRIREVESERDSLASRLMADRELREQNDHLRDVYRLPFFQPGAFLVTEIMVGQPRYGQADRFLVRAGRTDGVVPPTAVVRSRGLLGVVREADAHHAAGEYWTHPDFRVSVRTEDGETSGIVRSQAGQGGQPVMLLEGAPFQAQISAGTLLVTSGVAGIFPPGIPVGWVRSLSASESGWEKSYLVEPVVRPAEAGPVLVWRRPSPAQ